MYVHADITLCMVALASTDDNDYLCDFERECVCMCVFIYVSACSNKRYKHKSVK